MKCLHIQQFHEELDGKSACRPAAQCGIDTALMTLPDVSCLVNTPSLPVLLTRSTTAADLRNSRPFISVWSRLPVAIPHRLHHLSPVPFFIWYGLGVGCCWDSPLFITVWLSE